MNIKEILENVEIKKYPSKEILDKEFMGLSIDSREIKEGQIFVALKGENNNGNDYILDSLEKGTVLAITDDENYVVNDKILLVKDCMKAIQMIAKNYRNHLDRTYFLLITGSSGKTTCKDILYQLISTKYNTFATEKNLNNELGVPLNVLNIMYDRDIAIIEGGMNHYGELENISFIVNPDYLYITNIGEAHIEYFGSLENIAKAKCEIFKHAKDNAIFFLNSEDKVLLKEYKKYIKDNIKTYEIYNDFKIIDFDFYGTKFLYKDEIFETNLIGEHNIMNLIQCIKIAEYLGVNKELWSSKIKHLKITHMRMERITKGGEKIINDAYNANPSSMIAGLKMMKDIKINKGEKILVLGDMLELGEKSQELHEKVGNFINENFCESEELILFGEKAKFIGDKVFNICVHYFKDNKEALINFIKSKYLHKNNLFYFKASRGMALDKVIEEIIK